MFREIGAFNGAKATHVVSLGQTCAVAYNLRRYFDFDSAFPFDWWVTPQRSLELFLADMDVDYLYDPNRLELVQEGTSVQHRDLGITLHHEFPREWTMPRTPIRSDWKQHIERPKSRTTALTERFRALNAAGNRVAFVSHSGASQVVPVILDSMFDKIDWTFVRFDNLDQPNVGWKNDPARWNGALQQTGLVLDRRCHRSFVEKTSEPTYESLIEPTHNLT